MLRIDFCKKYCTEKLGWNAVKRAECRVTHRCLEYDMQEVKSCRRSPRLDTIYNIASYWIGVSECQCNGSHPIGSCLKCDMRTIAEKVKEERKTC